MATQVAAVAVAVQAVDAGGGNGRGVGGSDGRQRCGRPMPTASRRGRRRSGAGGDGGGGVSGGDGGGGERERRQRRQRPQGRQCLRPAPPSSELSPPGQLHTFMYMYTSRVYTVCRGMTVCARCYIMLDYLNRPSLILCEHTNADRAVTRSLSREIRKSDIKLRGRV